MKDSKLAIDFTKAMSAKVEDLKDPDGTQKLIYDLLERIACDHDPSLRLASMDISWALGIVTATLLASMKKDTVATEEIVQSFAMIIYHAMQSLVALDQDWTKLV